MTAMIADPARTHQQVGCELAEHVVTHIRDTHGLDRQLLLAWAIDRLRFELECELESPCCG